MATTKIAESFDGAQYFGSTPRLRRIFFGWFHVYVHELLQVRWRRRDALFFSSSLLPGNSRRRYEMSRLLVVGEENTLRVVADLSGYEQRVGLALLRGNYA